MRNRDWSSFPELVKSLHQVIVEVGVPHKRCPNRRVANHLGFRKPAIPVAGCEVTLADPE
jgi:hypothetical protein